MKHLKHTFFMFVTGDPDYLYDTGMWRDSETHAGEDVQIYAQGPLAHLFQGVHEQNFIAHVMMYAACIGPNKNHCDTSAASSNLIGHQTFYVIQSVLLLHLLAYFVRHTRL